MKEGVEAVEKSRRTGRLLAVFKAMVLLGLAAATAYGLLKDGLYADDLWLPVADGILALVLVTVFVRGYYTDVPQAAWIVVAFLAAVVGVKGLSMLWTISETATLHEVLRSSMYLGVFVAVLGALTSRRQVGPLMDVAILMVAAVAGYGLLQKINPLEYPIRSVAVNEVRVDSTIGYVNTTAIIVVMGVMLAVARMMTIRNALMRGVYAALALAFLITLYLTVSRGGIAALGVGMIVLLLLTEKRLQLIVNLLLLAVPGAWLVWRVQSLHNFFEARISDQHKMVLGTAFRNDLIVALVVAFALQAAYAFLTSRYELPRYELPTIGRRGLVALLFGATVLVIGAGTFLVASKYGGIGQAYETIVSNPSQTKNATQRLASLNPGYREDYWKVAWDAWKEHPLTGTGAGTFKYIWLENRPNTQNVQQVHNLYLEQGTETGIFAFLALVGFVVTLVGYSARGAWRARGERRVLLAGLISTLVVYLLSSFLEWHWYIPGSTLFFFFLAAITLKFALKEDWDVPETEVSESPAVKQP